jgi:hypothetical protein
VLGGIGASLRVAASIAPQSRPPTTMGLPTVDPMPAFRV